MKPCPRQDPEKTRVALMCPLQWRRYADRIPGALEFGWLGKQLADQARGESMQVHPPPVHPTVADFYCLGSAPRQGFLGTVGFWREGHRGQPVAR